MIQLVNPRGRVVSVSISQVDKLIANGWTKPMDKQTANYNPLYDQVVNKDGPRLVPYIDSVNDYLEGVITIW